MIRLTQKNLFAALRRKRVALVGFGVSHRALARLLVREGVPVTVYEKKPAESLGDEAGELRRMGAVFVTGPDSLERLTGDVIFRTPGLYFHHPKLAELRRAGAVVTSEQELFFTCRPCPVIAVSGSDGKTTTASLAAAALRAAGRTVRLGGNIGKAMLSDLPDIRADEVAVAELSSFQLLSMRPDPEVAVLTNVSPNHLDVHGTMEEYIGAKRNLLLHQDAFSVSVLNADDDVLRGFQEDVRGELRLFSRRHPVENGAYLRRDGRMVYACHGAETPILPREELLLPGPHNVENFLAAAAAVWGEVPVEAIRETGRSFAGVEHRIELVRERNGIRWYNDSIATSPTRTAACLRSFDRKVILIAGGYDKALDYAPLAGPILERVKCLILTGATGPKIRRAVTERPDFPASGLILREAADLEEAVAIADGQAEPGDIVTLSPASASFDAYPNFEARGRRFRDLVRALP